MIVVEEYKKKTSYASLIFDTFLGVNQAPKKKDCCLRSSSLFCRLHKFPTMVVSTRKTRYVHRWCDDLLSILYLIHRLDIVILEQHNTTGLRLALLPVETRCKFFFIRTRLIFPFYSQFLEVLILLLLM